MNSKHHDGGRAGSLELALKLVVSGLVLLAVVFGGNELARRFLGGDAETAIAAATVAALSADGVARDGTRVVSPGGTFTIVSECTGLSQIVLLGACVIAFPGALSRRVVGMLLVVLFSVGLNLARVIALVWLSYHIDTGWHLIHDVVWPVAIVLGSVAFFSTWAAWAIRPLSIQSRPVDA